jgi:hypothetical protein
MFENVPSWLTEKVRAIKHASGVHREQIYLHAAGWVIAYYLRIDVSARGTHPFFENRTVDDSGILWHGTVNRVLHVAEYLFLLRSCPGFPEFCRRMREGSDLRSQFIELQEATRFFKAGYQIDAKPPRGVRGEDFDFIATRREETVNVEVTAFNALGFSENTVINALNWKRKQVPDTAPAIIICIFPESWLPTGSSAKLGSVAEKFLRGTKRINFVVFASEVHIDLENNAGALVFWHQVHENVNARIKMSNSSFLESGRAVSVRPGGVTVHDKVTMADLAKEAYDSEFFRWIDQLVPTP